MTFEWTATLFKGGGIDTRLQHGTYKSFSFLIPTLHALMSFSSRALWISAHERASLC